MINLALMLIILAVIMNVTILTVNLNIHGAEQFSRA